MAEDRMLSDEILLGLIKANSGGGGGGTSNYNDLSNKPQIGGVTLSGNKSASDLGLVAAVDGKGLSTNDYTDADKAIVGGVTAALAGKQGALTAGNNIKIDDDTISVNRWFVPAGKVVYTIITSDENYGQNVHVQRHTPSGGFIDDRVYLVQSWQTKTVDDVISIEDQYAKYKITLLKDSDEQSAGYYYMVNPTTTPTSNSFTFTMSQEENANDLIIRSELDAEVNAIKDGQSIDSFADVESALANKQDKTDNSLQTTDKTVVGAINEHEGDISSLKSGLTNYEATINSALDLPENTGKNLIPLSVATLKSINTSGTWNGNAYTFNGVTFTVQTNANDNITGIKATGTATGGAAYMLLVSANNTNPFTMKMLGRTVILNGCPAGGGENTYKINIYYAGQTNVIDTGSGATKTYPTTGDNNNIALNISNGYEIATGGIMFYPMLRMADITDATFAPYIPSVESRIEAVETRVETIESAVQTKTDIASAPIDGSNAVEINVTNLPSYDFVVCGVSYYDTGIANYGFVMIPVSEFLLFSDSGTKIFFSKIGGGVSFIDVKADNNRTKITFTPESGVTPTGRYYFVHGIKTR